MMTVFAIIPGVVIPAIVGWLTLDLLEHGFGRSEGRSGATPLQTPLLGRCEKWVWGFALGMTFSMFCVFLGNVFLGVPLTLAGFLGVFAAMVVPLGGAWLIRTRSKGAAVLRPYIPPMWNAPSRPAAICLGIAGGWIMLRVIAMAIDIAVTPTFFDDAMDNWNLRGKLFFFQKTIALSFPWDLNPGVSSYPPAVSLSKAWLSTLAGTWNEGLINSIHGVWFICLILIVYWTLRHALSRAEGRMLPVAWSALGAVLLASLPLELIHGTNPYADVFLSLHLFMAVSLLFQALTSRAHEQTPSCLRLAAFAIALIPFTKNEGWALYFPVLILLFTGSVTTLWRRGTITGQQAVRTALWTVALVALVTVPWISYKMLNGLAFGNAKGIDWNLQWQPGVTIAIVVNTFFEGNWGLLFPLFFGLLIARWRAAFRTPLLLLSVFVLIPYLLQLFLYHTTGLSTEAILQTGYARGLIHLMPVIVALTIMLLYDVVASYETRKPATRNP